MCLIDWRVSPLTRYWFGAVAVVWLCLAAVGLAVLWQYDNAPGEPAKRARIVALALRISHERRTRRRSSCSRTRSARARARALANWKSCSRAPTFIRRPTWSS